MKTLPKLTLLTVAEAAKILDVHRNSVLRMHSYGHLRGLLTTTGWRLFLEADVLKLARARANKKKAA